MNRRIAVSLENVAKRYAQHTIFEKINLVIDAGECFAVTGRNGSGKSTLLKIIAGLIRPSSGKVFLTTGDGNKLAPEEISGEFGLVSSDLLFYKMLTGYENVTFFAKVTGLNIARERIIECLRVLELADTQNEQVATYSTGMRQRLKFALLLALKPGLWLLDEPFSNLDSSGKKIVDKLIRQALGDQTTIIIATNEVREEQYATRKLDIAAPGVESFI